VPDPTHAAHRRTLAEVQARFDEMPFARLLGVRVVDAGGGRATMTMPLAPSVAYTDGAFAGAYVGVLADLACGAAALAALPVDVLPVTVAVDATVTGSTAGSELRAQGTIAIHDGTRLVLHGVVEVGDPGGPFRPCGAAMVTLRAASAR